MSDFNNKLVIDLYEECDALKADVVRLTLKVDELHKCAEEQRQRIKMLVEAGDALKTSGYFGGWGDAVNKWVKVKEAKP